LFLKGSDFPHRLLEGVVRAIIIALFERLRCQSEADSVRREILDYPPKHRPDILARIRSVEEKILALLAIVDCYGEAARYRDEDLLKPLCAWPARVAPVGTS
jgi:hypothetical protein